MILHKLQRSKTNNDIQSSYYRTGIRDNGKNITSTTGQRFESTP